LHIGYDESQVYGESWITVLLDTEPATDVVWNVEEFPLAASAKIRGGAEVGLEAGG
jgi:hypothetical protein